MTEAALGCSDPPEPEDCVLQSQGSFVRHGERIFCLDCWMMYLGKSQVTYASAKATLNHFSRAIGVMYAGKGIRLNLAAPGMVNTRLIRV